MSDLKEYRIPAWCPVCERIMKGSFSNVSYYDWKCCSDCYIQWVEGREDRWKSGWRPTKEMLDSFIARISK